ncbi:MAG: PadR family transcriptional regulator [Chloroflexi bacterium]|nr:PadR family transcriptional regulator [Anaerolineaceae bacterium]NMB86983.1 PadR family transcriptional regulator [Chloroflexota bacterium]
MNQLQQLRKGSTFLLILDVLSGGKKYGYQIMRELEQRSEGYFSMNAALLYPALHQLEQDGLVEAEWEEGQGGRRRKYYTITENGHRALDAHRAEWSQFITRLGQTLHNPLNETGESAS